MDENGAIQILLFVDQFLVKFLFSLGYLLAEDVHFLVLDAFLLEHAIESENLLSELHVLTGKLVAFGASHR